MKLISPLFSCLESHAKLDEALATSVLTEISSKFLVSARYSMRGKSRSINYNITYASGKSEWCDKHEKLTRRSMSGRAILGSK